MGSSFGRDNDSTSPDPGAILGVSRFFIHSLYSYFLNRLKPTIIANDTRYNLKKIETVL